MLAAGGSDEAAWFMKDSGNLSRMVEREVKGFVGGSFSCRHGHNCFEQEYTLLG